MPRAKKKLILTQPESTGKAIKVKLDHRTMITIKSMSALDFWKERYPRAQVVR